jgi:hypothetical protein
MADQDQPQVWDLGLQPERTSLAWRRLGLTFFALALASLKLTWPILGEWALLPTLLVAGAAISLLIHSSHRYATMHRSLTGSRHLPDGRMLLATALIALGLTVLALFVVTVR